MVGTALVIMWAAPHYPYSAAGKEGSESLQQNLNNFADGCFTATFNQQWENSDKSFILHSHYWIMIHGFLFVKFILHLFLLNL